MAAKVPWRSPGEDACCCGEFTCEDVPETFDITVSGVDPCGCVGNLLVTSSAPAFFTLTRTGGDSWESGLTGSTSVKTPPGGGPTGDCTEFFDSAKWKATAVCGGNRLRLGILVVCDVESLSIEAFKGDVVPVTGVAENEFTCAPGFIMGGGFATYPI